MTWNQIVQAEIEQLKRELERKMALWLIVHRSGILHG